MDTDSYWLLSQYIVAQNPTIMRVQVQKLVVGIILYFLENIKNLAVGGVYYFFYQQPWKTHSLGKLRDTPDSYLTFELCIYIFFCCGLNFTSI